MQTASTFTPWTLVHNENQGCFEIKVDTAPGKFSPRIACTYSDNEQAEKDARLIAMLPELVEALREMHAAAEMNERPSRKAIAAADAILTRIPPSPTPPAKPLSPGGFD